MDSPTGMVDLPAGWEKATHKGRTSGEGTVAAFQQGRVNESHPSSAGPLAKMINFNQALIGHTRPNKGKRRLGSGVATDWQTTDQDCSFRTPTYEGPSSSLLHQKVRVLEQNQSPTDTQTPQT